MKGRRTDAELVEALRLVRDHGTVCAAARAAGVNRAWLSELVNIARSRGFTADSKVENEADKLRIRVKQLERDLASVQKDADTAELIRKKIFDISERTPEPPAWIAGKRGRHGDRGVPTMIWSDWHWGEVVNPDEIGGINEFNARIAADRVKRLINNTIDIADNHMGSAKVAYPGAVLMLGGDMVGGDIHEELMATNDRTTHQSINDLTDILASGLDRMATKFGRLFVPCVVGNHGRSTRKPRMKGRVFTNHDWSIYCNLERYFRRDKHIQFMIPAETDAYFTVYGHRYLLTHGDSLGVKGGDGIIGALGPIMRGSLKVSRSEAQVGREFDTLVIGHWHQYLTLPGLVVNNSLKGYDEYARVQLRAAPSTPSQALWFTHPERGITAHWQVFLDAKRWAQDNKEWVSWLSRR